MAYKLKKDLVIPAGTIFTTAPTRTERYGNGHIQADFGLDKDTSGDITYVLDACGLPEWFEKCQK